MFKIIAFLLMILDHIGFIFAEYFKSYDSLYFFRAIGRLAFPMFAFLTAKGAIRTSNRWNYFLRLFLTALLSQGLFAALCAGLGLEKFYVINVLFTLACAVAFITCLEKVIAMHQGKDKSKTSTYIFAYIGMLLALIVPIVMKADYGLYGICMVLAFYLFMRFRDEIKSTDYLWLLLIVFVFNFVRFLNQGIAFTDINRWNAIGFMSLLAVPLFSLEAHDRKPKRIVRDLMYLVYPIHYAILLIIYKAIA